MITEGPIYFSTLKAGQMNEGPISHCTEIGLLQFPLTSEGCQGEVWHRVQRQKVSVLHEIQLEKGVSEFVGQRVLHLDQSDQFLYKFY